MVQPLDHQQGNQGCPNLDAKGVLALSYEGFDLQVLLQRLEEELDLPPASVNRLVAFPGLKFPVLFHPSQD